MSDFKGKLFVFSAPSGSGKTTIVRHLLKQERFNLEFSISATSRAPRGTEKDGEDYYFISLKEFKNNIKSDAFLEWEEVYRDNFYGTLKSEVERIWAQKKHVIFDIDVVGGLRIKKKFPEETSRRNFQNKFSEEIHKNKFCYPIMNIQRNETSDRRHFNDILM